MRGLEAPLTEYQMEVGSNWYFVRAKIILSAVCVWKQSFLSGLKNKLLLRWFSEKLVPRGSSLVGQGSREPV